jgi:superfamily II DNA or RNA helicase
VNRAIYDILRYVLVETLLSEVDVAKSPRVLADSANKLLPRFIRPAFLFPFGRADVERILATDSDWFEISSGGVRLSSSFRTALLTGSANRPQFSPLFGGSAALALHGWQRQALEKWRLAGRRGIVSAVTGSGKTRLGIAAIEGHLRVPTARVAVLVPTIELMHQWLEELRKAFFVTLGAAGDAEADRLIDHAIVVLVARSASELLVPEVTRIAATHHVLLVADECHRYGAESYARALKAPYAATLGLSATPERDHDSGMDQHVFPALGDVVFDYKHEQAVADGVVADFRVLFVGVQFEPLEQSRHEELSAQIARTRAALCSAHPFLERAKPLVEAVKILAGRDEGELARRWLALVAERRRLLCNAHRRHAFVEWLSGRPELRRTKLLVFHESIADCQRLADSLCNAGIIARAHHSELDRFKRASILAGFANGDVQAVISPHTLDEGIDVPDASLAVIAAGSRVRRQSIQRIGRILRRAPDKKHARLIRVFIRGGSDDPSTTYPDLFSKDMMESGRGEIADWPEDSPAITRFIAEKSHHYPD